MGDTEIWVTNMCPSEGGKGGNTRQKEPDPKSTTRKMVGEYMVGPEVLCLTVGGNCGGNTRQKEPEPESTTRLDPEALVTNVYPPENTHQTELEQDRETRLKGEYMVDQRLLGGAGGGNTRQEEPEPDIKTRKRQILTNMCTQGGGEYGGNTRNQRKERRTSVADRVRAFKQLDIGTLLHKKPVKQPTSLVHPSRPETKQFIPKPETSQTEPEVACTNNPTNPPLQIKPEPQTRTPQNKQTKKEKPKPASKTKIPENQPKILNYIAPRFSHNPPKTMVQPKPQPPLKPNPKRAYQPKPILASPRLKPASTSPSIEPVPPNTPTPELTSTTTLSPEYKPQPTIAEPKLKLHPPKNPKPEPPVPTLTTTPALPENKPTIETKPAKITRLNKPRLKSVNSGKEICDMNTLRAFLARKKLERENKLLSESERVPTPPASHTGDANSTLHCTPSLHVTGHIGISKPNLSEPVHTEGE